MRVARIAVAGPNEAAAEAGAEVARAGGSAVDAALAAMLVALVTEPGVSSLGGGAFVTLAAPGTTPVTIDGTVAMPGRGRPRSAFGGGVRTVEMAYGGGTTTEVGHGSVAVPGMLPTFELAHVRYGRLPWAEVVAPAIDRARSGFRLGSAAAFYLTHAREHIFDADPAARTVLRDPAGIPLRAGETMLQPELAAFLELVAAKGAAALHAGDVAAAIEADMTAHGGLLTAADLAGYRPQVRPALRIRCGDWWLATNPAPAVGGVVLAAMLTLLERRDDVARMVDVQRAVLSRRVRELDAAADRSAAAAALLADAASPGPGSPATVHVSAAGADGLACAITASAGYGAGVSAPGTGVWLNNCLGERELNRRGFHVLPVGERLVSNMAPTAGVRDDGAVLAIGSPGADRITTAILQTLLPVVHGGAALADAVAHPRLHVTVDHDGEPLRIEHEADLALPDDVAPGLPRREHPPRAMYFGGVGVCLRHPGGGLDAAADPRREGGVRVTG